MATNGERRSVRIQQRHGYVIRAQVGRFARVGFMAHAVDRMESRGISEADVLQTLREPDETGLPTQPGRKRVRWQKTPRVAIDVVYEELADEIAVVTVMDVTPAPIIRRRRK